ncbi:MAG: hypothetical protein ACTSXX_06025 [Candidatus Baldrarchaeia archaeon]
MDVLGHAAYCAVAVPLIYVLTMWYEVVGLIIGTAVGWFVSLVMVSF